MHQLQGWKNQNPTQRATTTESASEITLQQKQWHTSPHAILTLDDPHEPQKEQRQSMMKRRTLTSSTDNS